MTGSKLTVSLGLLAMFVAAAAVGSQYVANAAEPTALLPGDKPVEHPIHSRELLAAMADLEKLTLEDLPSQLESDAAREARLEEVRKIAAALAAAAAQLPDMLKTTDLSAEEERRFRELAAELGREASALRERAEAGDVENARDEREILLATCNACHAEFREMPTGPGIE